MSAPLKAEENPKVSCPLMRRFPDSNGQRYQNVQTGGHHHMQHPTNAINKSNGITGRIRGTESKI